MLLLEQMGPSIAADLAARDPLTRRDLATVDRPAKVYRHMIGLFVGVKSKFL
jgi:hypothetical protein